VIQPFSRCSSKSGDLAYTTFGGEVRVAIVRRGPILWGEVVELVGVNEAGDKSDAQPKGFSTENSHVHNLLATDLVIK